MADPFTCPFCGLTSHHPKDASERFCGRCGVFIADAAAVRDELGACRGHTTTSVRTTEHMERCRACGTEVRADLVDHPLLGFRAGCSWAAVGG